MQGLAKQSDIVMEGHTIPSSYKDDKDGWINIDTMSVEQIKEEFNKVGLDLGLPSQHQIDDGVVLDFGVSGKLVGCMVTKVHFTKPKVTYDVVVRVAFGDDRTNDLYTRLHNIDSVFVLRDEPMETDPKGITIEI